MFVGSRSELTPSVLEDIYGEIQTEELREGTEATDPDESTQSENTSLGAEL
jgi:phosphonate transport system ATP-binding protein